MKHIFAEQMDADAQALATETPADIKALMDTAMKALLAVSDFAKANGRVDPRIAGVVWTDNLEPGNLESRKNAYDAICRAGGINPTAALTESIREAQARRPGPAFKAS